MPSFLYALLIAYQAQNIYIVSASMHNGLHSKHRWHPGLTHCSACAAATYTTSFGAPAPAPGGSSGSSATVASVSDVNGGTSSGENQGSTASGAKG